MGDLYFWVYGQTQGVAVSHQSALNTILDVNSRNAVGPNIAGCLASRNSTLIFPVYDIFGTLAAGAVLVLPQQCGICRTSGAGAGGAYAGYCVWNLCRRWRNCAAGFSQSHRRMPEAFAPLYSVETAAVELAASILACRKNRVWSYGRSDRSRNLVS